MKLRRARGETWELAWRGAPSVGIPVRSVAGFSEWAGQPHQAIERATPRARLVILLGDTVSVGTAPGVTQRLRSFVAGPRAVPAVVDQPGSYRGIEVALTVASAAALIGMPLGDLDGPITALDDVLDERARQLHKRLGQTKGWDDAFDVLDDSLPSCNSCPVDDRLQWAWRAIERSAGRVRVGSLAEQIGWSRRHFASTFERTYGITPKAAARLFRYEGAARMLTAGTSLAGTATMCGYFDQAHMHRDFGLFDGRTPARVADGPTRGLEAAWPLDGS